MVVLDCGSYSGSEPEVDESDDASRRLVLVSLLQLAADERQWERQTRPYLNSDLQARRGGGQRRGSCAMSAVAKAACWSKCRDCEETLVRRIGTGRVIVMGGRVHGQFQVGSGR